MFPVKNTIKPATHYVLQRQNAWSEKKLNTLINYSKSKE